MNERKMTDVPATRGGVTAALATATAIGSLGLGAGGTAGALVAVELTGHTAAAGWPLGVLVVGQALGALLISRGTRLADRWLALAGGYGIGAAGAALVVLAGEIRSFPLMLAGSALLGVANAGVYLTRYGVIEVTDPQVRGRALGAVFGATAVGAVAGVFLLGPSAVVAHALGMSGFLGLYLLAVVAFVAAAVVLLRLRASLPVRRPATTDDSAPPGRPGRVLWVPLGLLAVTNLGMTAIMVVAPVHLRSHGQTLELIGVVTAVHVLLMFGPSAVTGRLADRVGGLAVAVGGLGLLAAAALVGGVVDAADPWASGCFLALLGLGWNCGVVGGSALLATSLSGPGQLRAEGYGETAMGFAAALGSPVAGMLVAGGGFGVLSLAVAAAAVLGAGLLSLVPSGAKGRLVEAEALRR